MFLLIMFFVLCVAAAAVVSMLMRDSFIVKKMIEYVTVLQTYGDNSQEEYDFLSDNTSLTDVYHVIKAARTDAHARGARSVVSFAASKNKRTSSKVKRGKKG